MQEITPGYPIIVVPNGVDTTEFAPEKEFQAVDAAHAEYRGTRDLVFTGKMGSLRRGTRLQVLENSGDWAHVRVRNQDGYILSSLLTM